MKGTGKGRKKRKRAAGGKSPRELLVLRHGKSDWGDAAKRDFDRPLVGRGRKGAKRIGAWIRKRKLVPDFVVSSPAKRARQTTLVALKAMDFDPGSVKWDPRIYEATGARLLLVLGELPRSARRVLVVGHNPSLEDLVLHLGGDDVEIPKDGKILPTATLAHFRMPGDWGSLVPGCGRLVAVVRAKSLE